ncbi:MAG: alkaline phosphatase D family protein, partial [Planctomycetota bacterium]|nr:alkaline phosphatase D family protein [Planctomycetota bacterium]
MKSINSILRIRLARGSVFLPLALLSFSAGQLVVADSFESAVPSAVERLWIGPEYWANPLEDWRISNGRIECINNRGNRNVHLLTHQLAERRGDLAMTVNVGAFGDGAANDRQSWAGFRIGIHESIVDYRRNLLFGEGLDAGMTLKGVLFIGGPPAGGAPTDRGSAIRSAGGVKLRLRATPAGNGYTVTLDAVDVSSGEVRDSVSRENVRGERLRGNLALVCDSGERGRRRRGISKPAGLAPAGSRAAFWFRDWKVAGSKVAGKPDQTFGPILWAMHTLSRGVLKVTAQMPPLGKGDSQVVRLEIQRGGSKEWETLGEERIHPLARTATFRVESWNDDVDTPYRLVYSLTLAASSTQDHFWRGTVRRDPVDKDEITVAGFTGNTDAGFPNDRIARNVAIHDPDVLFFSGDQIYESVGGYGIYREPVDLAVLSYLRKWYLFGWAFRDLLRDRPALCLPDDHDVFQGNIWGEGGRRVAHIRDHPRGGYRQHRDFVNAVQRTQTSHHPAPFDPTPIEQGIEVYYGDMVYGRISFAVLEDRKFKSGPQGKVNSWKGRPDHVRDPDYEPASVDKPGLVLLGERQLEFLRHWAADWRGADMKVACSQTIFANVANYHGANRQYLVADLDSNGWPQAGRNRALRELRRGFALLYAG